MINNKYHLKITIKLLNTDYIQITNTEIGLLQSQITSLKFLIGKLITDKNKLDDWIPEKEAMSVSGLSRGTLLKLRKEGEITSSTLSGKQVFYRISDFNKLLNKNEENR